MVNEAKKIKLESLVNEINGIHDNSVGYSIGNTEILRLIFDVDELNEYGQIVVKNAKFIKCGDKKINADIVKKRIIANEWISFCNNGEWDKQTEGFYFIFWALLVLSVDKTDKEEKLSIICDFAKSLQITDEEVKDIVEIIKIIYGRSESEVLNNQCHSALDYEAKKDLFEKKYLALKSIIKSENTYRSFSKLLEKYVGINENQIKRYINFGEVDVPLWI